METLLNLKKSYETSRVQGEKKAQSEEKLDP